MGFIIWRPLVTNWVVRMNASFNELRSGHEVKEVKALCIYNYFMGFYFEIEE